MKQGIDPTTHKPLSTEADRVKEEKKSTEATTPLQMPLSLSQEVPSATSTLLASSSQGTSSAFLISDSNYYDSGVTLDPLSFCDFQMGVMHSAYNLPPVSHCHTSQFGLNSNSSYGFCSMPGLTNSDHGNVSVTEFSDNNSGSNKISSLLFMNNDHQVKESSSNSSNMSSVYQMRSVVENAGFSWDGGENKLDPLIQQFQVNAIKSEEFGTSSWEEGQLQTHNSIDFTSYPLTSLSEDLTGANFDVFHHI